MNILILGAGQVGSTVAQFLVKDGHNITIVDTNEKKLSQLKSHSDLNTIVGSGTDLDILEQSGIEDADMLIAVMDLDERNIIACNIAKNLYQIDTKIARIRNTSLIKNNNYQKVFNKKVTSIDAILTPEKLITSNVAKLIQYPGALQIVNFEQGLISLAVCRIEQSSKLCGIEMRNLRNYFIDFEVRVVAIYRKDKAIMPSSDDYFIAGDEVFCITVGEALPKLMQCLVGSKTKNKKILVAGGGNIGINLAKTLEQNYSLRLIEQNLDRCEVLSDDLSKTIILNGSAHNIGLLKEENISNTDVFIATMNRDSDNVLAAFLAKQYGAKQVIAVLNEPSLLESLEGKFIDIVVTPSRESTSHLLSFVRSGDTVQAIALRHDIAEMLEIVVHGDNNNSAVVGKAIKDIKLPKGTGIGAIVRVGKINKETDKQVLIARSNTIICDLDRLIIFTLDRTNIKKIEKLFQAPLGFF